MPVCAVYEGGDMRSFIKSDPCASNKRRGLVAVFVVAAIPVLLAFAALTIDVGTMYNVRADLQRAADAAALAGASTYTNDAMMQLRQDASDTDLLSAVIALGTDRLGAIAGLNPSFGSSTMLVAPGDITTGWIDVDSATAPIQPDASPDTFNAVQVVVRRTSEGANGPVKFFFASIFGSMDIESSASAVAVFNDRVSGFETESADGLLPSSVSGVSEVGLSVISAPAGAMRSVSSSPSQSTLGSP